MTNQFSIIRRKLVCKRQPFFQTFLILTDFHFLIFFGNISSMFQVLNTFP